MKTREWKSIIWNADLCAFLVYILEQPETKTWQRKNGCACPLHDFIEAETGYSLSINSPELSEHWAERATQSWPTPWWMTWVMRSVDHAGAEGTPITKDELLSLALIMIDRDFNNPIMSQREYEEAA